MKLGRYPKDGVIAWKIVTGPCKLLELPGEIRNKIYGYLLEDINRYVIRRGRKHPTFLRNLGDKGMQYGRDSLILPRLSFAHLCRTIRKEFRPLWLRCLCINIEDIHIFTHHFIEQKHLHWYDSMTMFGKQVGIVSIEFGSNHPYSVHVDWSKTDVTGLFKLKARYPDCQIQLDPSPTERYIDTLRKILNNRNTIWRSLVLNDAIVLAQLENRGHFEVRLQIWFKKGYLHEILGRDHIFRPVGLTKEDANEVGLYDKGVSSFCLQW